MTTIKPLLIWLISSFFLVIKTQEPITNAQRIFEYLNYGPIGLLIGILPSTISSLNITKQCHLSFNHAFNELHNGSSWSNLMFSSSGKELKNLLEASFLNLGNYDTCLSIESNKINSNQNESNQTNRPTYFYGKYCLLDIVPQTKLLTPYGASEGIKKLEFINSSLNVSQKLDLLFRFSNHIQFKTGFCVPSTCTDNDVIILINSVLDEYLFQLYRPVNCQTKATQSFKENLKTSKIGTQISFFILINLLIGVVLCTFIHIILVKYNGFSSSELIKCFSLKQNISTFLSPQSNGSIILNGFQSFVILIYVISNTFLYFIWLDAYVLYDKFYDYLFNAKNLLYQPLYYIFDTFNISSLFLISSTFASIKLFSIQHLTFSKCIQEIIEHLLIYFPIMIILVVIQLNLPLFISGPIANQFLARDAEFCSQSWYKTILFINNFDEFDSQCVINSWIISTEVQMFIIVVVFVYLYSKMPCLAKILNLVLIFLSISIMFIIVYSNFLNPSLIQMPLNLEKIIKRAKLIHFPLETHLLEYFLPLFVFSLIRSKRKRFEIVIRRYSFYVLIFVLIIIQFYTFTFNSFDYEGTRALNTFLILISKLILSILYCWIIYNYYDLGVDQVFNEIGIVCKNNSLGNDHLMKRNRLNSIKSNVLKVNGCKKSEIINGDLEMEINSNGGLNIKKDIDKKDENDKLMNDKSIKNDINTNSKLLSNGFLIDGSINDDLINNKLLIDKFIIEMLEKSISNKNRDIILDDKIVHDKPIEIKLNEIFNQDHYLTQFNLHDTNSKNGKWSNEHILKLIKENRNKNSNSSFKNLIIIYTKLSRSIFYSNHFYLSYDLYSIRNPISTDFYDIISRLIHNLFYIHLIAILFHLFIELPLHSFTKLIYTRILKLFN